MFTQPIDHTDQFKKEKIRLGLWFGFFAGLVYTIVLWGVDGFALAKANAILPWAKLAMGILPVLAICILIGWICGKLENALVNSVLWMICGIVICIFTCHLPFNGMTQFYKWFNPALSDRVALPFNSGVSSRFAIVLIICAVISALGGLFFGMLLDNAHKSAARAGTIVPIILWMVVFGSMASVVNYMIQLPVRAPVIAVNKLVQQKAQSQIVPVSKEESRAQHMGALNSLEGFLNEPRNLILAKYDSSLIQTNVEINFGGTWVECVVIANSETEPPVQQPVFCREMK
jgi:hypothetical protein